MLQSVHEQECDRLGLSKMYDGNGREIPKPERVKLRCLPNQVIVEPLYRSRRRLAIVDANPPPSAEGQVIAVGPCKRADGTMEPAEVFCGAWVMFPPFGGKDVEFGGKKLKVFKQSELEAVITG